jgi:hypothetical protein
VGRGGTEVYGFDLAGENLYLAEGWCWWCWRWNCHGSALCMNGECTMNGRFSERPPGHSQRMFRYCASLSLGRRLLAGWWVPHVVSQGSDAGC